MFPHQEEFDRPSRRLALLSKRKRRLVFQCFACVRPEPVLVNGILFIFSITKRHLLYAKRAVILVSHFVFSGDVAQEVQVRTYPCLLCDTVQAHAVRRHAGAAVDCALDPSFHTAVESIPKHTLPLLETSAYDEKQEELPRQAWDTHTRKNEIPNHQRIFSHRLCPHQW
jgi:hypothetical protein